MTGKNRKQVYPKKLVFYTLILISGFLCLWSCIDEIDLNIDTERRTLVVDGFVTDSLGDFRLELSESSVIGVGNDNILTPVPGAEVQLMDDEGIIYSYSELTNNPGTYELESFKAVRDRTYFIDIVLPGGQHYQSLPQKLRSGSIIDTVSYEINEEIFRNNVGELVTENIISARIATDFSNAEIPPYLRWRVEGEYQVQENYPGAVSPKRCYVKVNLDLNDLRILDASQVDGGILFEQVIAETAYDFRFGEQFCFHIYQFSISEEEYNYWNNIKEVIDIDGSLFDPPPGTVVGNIRNVDDPDDIAVGYFSVASVYFQRNFINRDETGEFVRSKCEGFFRGVPFGCNNCLLINSSTLERPPYWEF